MCNQIVMEVQILYFVDDISYTEYKYDKSSLYQSKNITKGFNVPHNNPQEEQSRTVVCVSCPNLMRVKKEDFVQHYKEIHKTNIAGFCDLCNKTFSSPSGYWMHKKMHQGGKGGCPQCTVCGKHFQGASYLKKHMRTHSDHRAFSCDVCGKAYKHEKSLKIHPCNNSAT